MGDERNIFLSTMPATRGDRISALAVVGVLAVLFACAVPFAGVPLTPVPAFVASYQSALAINDLITAVLLFSQFAISRSRAMLLLASGYLFTAIAAIVHALTFPGLFASDGLLGAGSQTTVWLYMIWHGGFPLLVLGYSLLKVADNSTRIRGSTGGAIVASIIAVGVAMAAFTWIVTAQHDLLPVLLSGGHYTPLMLGVVSMAWCLSLAALVTLWIHKPHSVLDIWLMVVMCAWLFDIALSAILNVARFDVGFYLGRIYGLCAASFVLAVLLVDNVGLQAKLASLLIGRDLTEKQAAEALLRHAQKMDAVGQLTGGVAHDFNNILTVITGTIGILEEAVAGEPQLAAVARLIDEAAERGANLTKHLLAFARKQPLQPLEVDVNALLLEAAKLLHPTLGEHIEITPLLAEDAWTAMVDPNLLMTAVLNLALNARDAMPHGGKLALETSNVFLDENYASMNSEVAAGNYVMIAVSDTGSGIPPALLERVFEPFFTTKEVGRGTGLGLSMVFGFVKQSGGHVKIYSEEGHGTSVKTYLPRATGLQQTAAEAQVSADIEGGSETVLVVEDDSLVRRYVMTQIESLGYTTLEAANASDALRIIDDVATIDLLFTDVIMPGTMNGRQLVDEALKRRPGLKTLFTSGYTENAIVHHGRLDTGVLLLAKPYRKSELARMLRLALAS